MLASDVPPGVVTLLSVVGAANRNTTTSAASEEVMAVPMTTGQTYYVFVDATAVTTGSTFDIEVTRCVREIEANNTAATANTLVDGVEGSISPAGEVDFFTLGTPATGSRVFAMIEGMAGNSTDFDLRVTTATDTLEYDDVANDTAFGGLAPNIAGTPLTGVSSFLRVNHFSSVTASEPYRVHAVVQPPLASATAEVEPNDTTATANQGTNNYFTGVISLGGATGDNDLYKFTAVAGDLVMLNVDGDPLRNSTPINPALALLDSTGAVLLSVDDGGSTSSTASGAGSLTATTPNSPAEALVYRIRTTGIYYARVNTISAPLTGDYLLSISGATSFTAPTVTTPTSSSITATTATLGGNVTADGGMAVTARGVVYAPTATNNNPQIGDTGVINVVGTGTTGVFTVNATGLTPGTAYSFKAYATNIAGTSYSSVGVFNTPLPSITNATYNASTGVLAVTGAEMTTGATIVANKLTLTGEGNTTYVLTSANVTATSTTAFSVTLNAADKAAVNQLLNKNGTTSTGGAAYNLAAASGWDSIVATPADTTNPITVSNVAVPTITSATYNASTGVLAVTGTNLLSKSGATNDIDVTKLSISGDATPYTLTSNSVDIIDNSSFSVTVNAADKTALQTRLNKSGTSSVGAVTYNLAAAEDWAAGADAAVVVADLTGNGITAILQPVLGVYPATTVNTGNSTTVTPSVAPIDPFSATASAPGFTGLLSVDPVTGVVRVTNAQVAGTYTVTVKAFNSAGLSATKTFTLTVTKPTACAGSSTFSDTTSVPVGAFPLSVAMGDFNGDGKLDFATANYSTNTVSIRLGDGAGNFSGTTSVPVGPGPQSIAVGDFNSDGKLDIATADRGANTVSIRLGDGAGNFSGTTSVAMGVNPLSVVAGDFNGDGKLDIAMADRTGNAVSIRLGDGAGNFSGTTSVPVGLNPQSVVVGDFNGDGKLDFATGNYGTNTVSIWFGDGAGNFSSATTVVVGATPTSVVVGDFNGDGKLDFATADRDNNTVSIRLNNCPPTIAAGAALSRTQAAAAISATIATVSDAETAAGSLVVTATTVPTGISITNIINTNGTITADVATSCSATVGVNTVVLTVTDGKGGIATANLIVNVTIETGAPIITAQPVAQSVAFGGTATFSVTATGATSYQWRKNGVNLTNATNSSYTIANAVGAGNYDVVIAGSGNCPVISKTVSLSVGPPICAGISFPTLRSVGVGFTPQSVAVGDFNGDGKLDVVTANYDDWTVSIRLGNGTGGVNAGNDFSVGAYPQSVAVGDFNGDGKLDVATADYGDSTVSILLGDGTGNFGGSVAFSVGSNPQSVAVGEFNGDGKLDVATADSFDSTVSILLGDGTGNFGGSVAFSVGSNPQSVAVGDFNGDGKQDLAIANFDANSVSIRLGNGAGGFTGTTDVSVGLNPQSVAVGDFNGDGKLDFAAANNGANTVSIRLGNGLGGFTGTANVSVGLAPFSVAMGDFNGDGKLDFAAANSNANTVSIRLGDGAGNFSGTTNVAVSSAPHSVAVGDFNSDGKLDFAAANTDASTVSIRLNGCNGQPVVIAGAAVTRIQGAAATNATIATVFDAETAAGSLVVTATTVPTGITISNIANAAGTITANVAAGCTATAGANTVVLTVIDGGGATKTANLTINVTAATPAAITTQPVAQTVLHGSAATFSVVATGATSYQWRKGGVNIGGATSSSYTISSTVVGDAGSYDVVVSGVCNTVTSNTAALTVNTPAPTLGNYADTHVALYGSAAILPSAAPANVNTMTAVAPGFTGLLLVNPVNGKVTVSNAQAVGTYTVTVTATGAGGNLTKTFQLIVDAAPGGAASTTATFASAPDVNVGTNPNSVVTGDFNGDGIPDLISANGDGTLSVRLGNGTGGFAGTTSVPVGANPTMVRTGDFNGDGILDVAVVNSGDNSISIRLGDGAGGFTGATNLPTGANPSALTLADLNGDGVLDVMVANATDGTCSVRLGNGAGGFSSATTFAVGANPQSIAVGDVDGDGKLDVAVVNADDGTISIRLGDGAGGFSGTTNVAVGTNPKSVLFGDFNGDGKLDFVAANAGSNNISLRLGNGTGGFAAPVAPIPAEIAVGTSPVGIVIGDFNGDGKLDFATANSGSNNVSLRLGDGAGSFTSAPDISVGTSPRALTTGDFNGDGKLDFAVANYGSNTLSIRLNNSNATPQITAAGALARTAGAVGAIATIATVSDAETAAGALTVTATTVPTGITITNITNTSGTITADVAAGCTATAGANTVVLTVTDAGGATATANLTVNVTASTAPLPTITTQPVSQSVAVNDTATFTVAGANYDTIQWQTSVNSGHFWTNIPGANSATYTMPVRPIYDGNKYRAVLTSCAGSVNSNSVILTVTGTSASAALTGIIIREFRLRGNGASADPAQDEYIELHNVTTNAITVVGDWAVAALSADGNSFTPLVTIPDGTVIPAKGHYLLTNPNGYSLGALAAAETGGTFTSDVPDDSGIALFNTTNPANFNASTKMDAVGFQSAGSAAALFREGTGLANLGATNSEYAWVRKMQNGQAVDTENNANDFMLTQTSGNSINGVTARMGAPSPNNSLGTVEMNSQIIQSLFDPLVASTSVPNQVRDTNPVTNGTFGTLSLRRSYTNNSGMRLTKVRFRLIDVTNDPFGLEAEIRGLQSVTATIDGKTVEGLTLQPLPAQPNGAGLNAVYVVGPDLPIGATIHIEMKFGIMRKGKYRFILNIEAAQ